MKVEILDMRDVCPPYENNPQDPSKYTIEIDGHKMTVDSQWYNCGEISTTYECSCGFHTTSASGGGCWQQGHNQAHEPVFDRLHEDMLVSALNQLKGD